MTGFGTIAWAQARDGGRMTRREQVRELARTGALVVRTAPAQARIQLGRHDRDAFAFDPDDLPLPDSSIARAAEEECRDCSTPQLVNHCLRTYVWGMLLARRDGLRPDPELLWVSALLHDIALTERHRHANGAPCFAVRGGLVAQAWAGEQGWDPQRCATLGEAISLHLNARVDPAHGPEAVLLQAGAGLDVLGLRAWQLSRETVAAVLARHPLLDSLGLLDAVTLETRSRTRAQLLWRLGFPLFARRSPLLAVEGSPTPADRPSG